LTDTRHEKASCQTSMVGDPPGSLLHTDHRQQEAIFVE